MYKLNVTLGATAMEKFMDPFEDAYEMKKLRQHTLNLNQDIIKYYARECDEFGFLIEMKLLEMYQTDGLVNEVSLEPEGDMKDKLINLAASDPQDDKILIADKDEFSGKDTSNINFISDEEMNKPDSMNSFRLYSRPFEANSVSFGTARDLKKWLKKIFSKNNQFVFIDNFILQVDKRNMNNTKVYNLEDYLGIFPEDAEIIIYSCKSTSDHKTVLKECKQTKLSKWKLIAAVYDDTFRNHDRAIKCGDFEVILGAGCDALSWSGRITTHFKVFYNEHPSYPEPSQNQLTEYYNYH